MAAGAIPADAAAMRRVGVALVLLGLGALFVAVQSHSSASAAVEHTCGLTDRQFIENYQLQLEGVGMYGSDYLAGNAKAADVIEAAQEAARVVRTSAPLDPSLRLVRRLAPAMFLDYAEAVRARERGYSASRQMYLAYTSGSRIEDALHDAEPGLTAAGCDVGDIA